MGRQINFFMAEGDEAALYDCILSRGAVVAHTMSQSCYVEVCDVLPPVGSSKYWAELCVLETCRSAEVQFRFLDRLRMYSLDVSRSPVIQFHRCRRDESVIHRGRIWAEMNSYTYHPETGTEDVVYKGEEFERLYESLARWLRTHFRREPKYGFYCGPAAWEAHIGGVDLDQE